MKPIFGQIVIWGKGPSIEADIGVSCQSKRNLLIRILGPPNLRQSMTNRTHFSVLVIDNSIYQNFVYMKIEDLIGGKSQTKHRTHPYLCNRIVGEALDWESRKSLTRSRFTEQKRANVTYEKP